jgi:RNA binding exosome subunit
MDIKKLFKEMERNIPEENKRYSLVLPHSKRHKDMPSQGGGRQIQVMGVERMKGHWGNVINIFMTSSACNTM